FFQAEDGIRGFHVTGVQTCALPIYVGPVDLLLHDEGAARQVAEGHGRQVLVAWLQARALEVLRAGVLHEGGHGGPPGGPVDYSRSEERRVGGARGRGGGRRRAPGDG